jgi:hypothetical protein
MASDLDVHVQMATNLKDVLESKKNGLEEFSFNTLDDSYFRSPDEKCLEVNMNVVVTNLCDIDTLNQSYLMRAELWVAWPLLKEEAVAYIKDPDEWKPVLHPRPSPWTVSIDSQDFMIFPSDRSIQVFIYEHKLMACECTLISARFLEGMELENFPFDCQHLSFHIGIRSDCDIPMRVTESGDVQVKDIKAIDGYMNFDGRAMMPLRLKQDACCFNVRTHLLSISDFDLHNIEVEIENMPDDIPFLHCAMRMSRNWYTYIYRVFLTMFFIECVSCTVFRFPTGLQDRLTFIATMLLTAVAFLFIVGGWLPQLKYLTLIDQYMMFAFAFITGLVVQITIYDAFELTLNQQVPIMAINLGICVGTHLGLCCYCWKLRHIETNKLTKNRREIDYDYENKVAGQSKDQFICHTGVSKAVVTGPFTVYTGSLRNPTLGWMMEREKKA